MVKVTQNFLQWGGRDCLSSVFHQWRLDKVRTSDTVTIFWHCQYYTWSASSSRPNQQWPNPPSGLPVALHSDWLPGLCKATSSVAKLVCRSVQCKLMPNCHYFLIVGMSICNSRPEQSHWAKLYLLVLCVCELISLQVAKQAQPPSHAVSHGKWVLLYKQP